MKRSSSIDVIITVNQNFSLFLTASVSRLTALSISAIKNGSCKSAKSGPKHRASSKVKFRAAPIKMKVQD